MIGLVTSALAANALAIVLLLTLASREKRHRPDYDPLSDCDCCYFFLCYNKAERGWATKADQGATALHHSPTGSIRRMRR